MEHNSPGCKGSDQSNKADTCSINKMDDIGLGDKIKPASVHRSSSARSMHL